MRNCVHSYYEAYRAIAREVASRAVADPALQMELNVELSAHRRDQLPRDATEREWADALYQAERAHQLGEHRVALARLGVLGVEDEDSLARAVSRLPEDTVLPRALRPLALPVDEGARHANGHYTRPVAPEGVVRGI